MGPETVYTVGSTDPVQLEVAVPEPASLTLVGVSLGVLALLGRLTRKRLR
jgi:hypothetical protein